MFPTNPSLKHVLSLMVERLPSKLAMLVRIRQDTYSRPVPRISVFQPKSKIMGASTIKVYAFQFRPWELTIMPFPNIFTSTPKPVRLCYKDLKLMRILAFRNNENLSNKARFMPDEFNNLVHIHKCDSTDRTTATGKQLLTLYHNEFPRVTDRLEVTKIPLPNQHFTQKFKFHSQQVSNLVQEISGFVVENRKFSNISGAVFFSDFIEVQISHPTGKLVYLWRKSNFHRSAPTSQS
jgi:hypothetical protein